MDPRVLLVGSSPKSARVVRKRARLDQSEIRLRAQQLKVKNAEIMARERADDREVERLKIDERRRWREEKQDEKRRLRAEKDSLAAIELSLKRVSDQLDAGKREAEEREKKEADLAAEVTNLLLSIELK